MSTTVLAVYRTSVLRPVQPLSLTEEETVQLTVARTEPCPTPTAEEAVERIRAARTLEEWIEAANAPSADENGYDLLQALEENRRLSGDQRRLFPGSPKGESG
jgi:predicted DNA-binding antitoxin AbrB/MazE fold protein